MGFWWFMFACIMLIPAMMVIAGYIMWKHCPREINSVLGYRTRRSMMNMDTWKFAHDYCGRLWWKLGWILVIPTVVAQIPFVKGTENKVGMVSVVITFVQSVVLLLSLIPTERALKKKFDENGRVRSSESV